MEETKEQMRAAGQSVRKAVTSWLREAALWSQAARGPFIETD